MKHGGRVLLIFGIIFAILGVIGSIGLNYIEEQVQEHMDEILAKRAYDKVEESDSLLANVILGVVEKTTGFEMPELTSAQKFGLYVHDHKEAFQTGIMIVLVTGSISTLAGAILTLLAFVKENELAKGKSAGKVRRRT